MDGNDVEPCSGMHQSFAWLQTLLRREHGTPFTGDGNARLRKRLSLEPTAGEIAGAIAAQEADHLLCKLNVRPISRARTGRLHRSSFRGDRKSKRLNSSH